MNALHLPSFFLGCVCTTVTLWGLGFVAVLNGQYQQETRDRDPAAQRAEEQMLTEKERRRTQERIVEFLNDLPQPLLITVLLAGFACVVALGYGVAYWLLS